MPAVAIQALERMSDPDLSVRELAEILRNDPAIVARLLSIANSAACGLKVHVTDVQQVVALLGKPAVVSIVMSIALAPPADIPMSHREHYRKYWNEAVTMATSVELVAKSAAGLIGEPVNAGEYFTAGLLADVGRLALLQNTEIPYVQVLEEASSNGEFARVAEERVLGTTHAAASVVLLGSWNAPEFLVEAVRHHHSSPDELEELADGTRSGLINAMIFSAAMCDYLGNCPKSELLDRLNEIGRRCLQLSEEQVEKHIEAVLDRMSETAELFTIVPTDIEDLRERFVAGLESAAVSASQTFGMAQSAASLREENEELSDRLNAITVRASRDSLTGVFNRDYFEACLSQHIGNGDSDLGLIFIDVDNFKEINDTHGHVAGDTLLKQLVGLMQSSIRSTDLLARFGGDEFVILVTGVNASTLQRIAERVQARVASEGFDLDGVSCGITISVGGAIAYADSLPGSVDEFFESADTAMYEAKLSGKNRVHIGESQRPSSRMRDRLLARVKGQRPASGETARR